MGEQNPHEILCEIDDLVLGGVDDHVFDRIADREELDRPGPSRRRSLAKDIPKWRTTAPKAIRVD